METGKPRIISIIYDVAILVPIKFNELLNSSFPITTTTFIGILAFPGLSNISWGISN